MPPSWAESWQGSWDQLEEHLVPDRERRLHVLLDVVEAITGTGPMVVDLACGPGSITRRLLDRFPLARSIAVDIDPVLLTIASATFAGDDRVRIVRADLNDRGWIDSLPEPEVDAVVTATALHWLPEHAVRRLYGDLAGLVRKGGVVAHGEKMPLVELPRLGAALAEVERQRHTVFETSYPTEEFSPPADWHVRALRDAGFMEAGVVWRSGAGAVGAAVR